MSKDLQIISEDKVQLVKDQICRGASDGELQLFIATCNRTNLDPFSKQCWAVKRWDSSLGREVMSFQTGVDGFRVIANRSDKYAGQVGPFWCGPDGVWKDVWLENIPPIAAKVGVLRSDFKEPLWAVAKFHSYAGRKKDGNLTPFWFKMPELMIAKVAECLALRKAFPQDLSGIYSNEEMDQALNEKEVTPSVDPKYKLLEPSPKDFERMRKIQEEVKETKTPPADQQINKEIEQHVSEFPTPQPEEPIKKPRNFAAGELAIPPQFAMLHKFGFVKNVPEVQAKAYLLKAKDWAKDSGKQMPESMIEMISALESFWGI